MWPRPSSKSARGVANRYRRCTPLPGGRRGGRGASQPARKSPGPGTSPQNRGGRKHHARQGERPDHRPVPAKLAAQHAPRLGREPGPAAQVNQTRRAEEGQRNGPPTQWPQKPALPLPQRPAQAHRPRIIRIEPPPAFRTARVGQLAQRIPAAQAERVSGL